MTLGTGCQNQTAGTRITASFPSMVSATLGGFLLEAITATQNLAILITFLCPNFETYTLLRASATLFQRTCPGAGFFWFVFT